MRLVLALAALGWASFVLTRRAVSRLLDLRPDRWGGAR
jgi:hypothetical protein